MKQELTRQSQIYTIIVRNRISVIINKLVATGFGHLFGSSVINRVLSLFSAIVLIRLIPKSEYGIYANANNILGLFCISEGLGLSTALLQYGCTWSGERKQRLWSFCFYSSALFNLVLAIAIIFVGLTVDFSIPGTGKYLVAMALLPFVRFVSEMQRIYMRTEFKNKDFAKANTFSTVVIVALSIILSYMFLVYGIIAAHYIAGIFTIAFICYHLKVRFPSPTFRLPRYEIKEIVKFSITAALCNSSAIISMLMDTFLLGIIVAQSPVTASYKVATMIPTALAFIPTCVMTYIYPYFAKNAENGQWCLRTLRKVILGFGAFNILLCLILILGRRLWILILFGEQYLDSAPPLCVLVLNYFISATFAGVCGQLLTTQRKLTFNLVVGIISAALNILLNILLIPAWGSVGAAFATVSATTFTAVVSSIYLIRIYKSKKICTSN